MFSDKVSGLSSRQKSNNQEGDQYSDQASLGALLLVICTKLKWKRGD